MRDSSASNQLAAQQYCIWIFGWWVCFSRDPPSAQWEFWSTPTQPTLAWLLSESIKDWRDSQLLIELYPWPERRLNSIEVLPWTGALNSFELSLVLNHWITHTLLLPLILFFSSFSNFFCQTLGIFLLLSPHFCDFGQFHRKRTSPVRKAIMPVAHWTYQTSNNVSSNQ